MQDHPKTKPFVGDNARRSKDNTLWRRPNRTSQRQNRTFQTQNRLEATMQDLPKTKPFGSDNAGPSKDKSLWKRPNKTLQRQIPLEAIKQDLPKTKTGPSKDKTFWKRHLPKDKIPAPKKYFSGLRRQKNIIFWAPGFYRKIPAPRIRTSARKFGPARARTICNDVQNVKIGFEKMPTSIKNIFFADSIF